jgi:LmbE family N-acetylglucosaminyl deacetylase
MTDEAQAEASADAAVDPEPQPAASPWSEPPKPDPDDRGPVLAVFGHPDDAEISSGGTMARWAKEGREVHLIVLTNGDRGSQDAAQDRAELARTRAVETEAAGRVLGLAGVQVLDTHDGDLANTAEVRQEVVRTVRRVRPTILLSCDPTAWFFSNRYYNHADHRTAGVIALDSVFPGAGNPHFFPEHLGEGLEVWSVKQVWLGWSNESNHYQDVTGFMDTKLKALGGHASQVEGDLLGFFEQWLPAEAEENGRKIGVQHAEAFRILDLS